MTRSFVAVAGLLAAGALLAPLAEAAPPTQSSLGLDNIPDPSGVADAPSPTEAGPVEGAAAGEPPDASDDGADPFDPAPSPAPVVPAALPPAPASTPVTNAAAEPTSTPVTDTAAEPAATVAPTATPIAAPAPDATPQAGGTPTPAPADVPPIATLEPSPQRRLSHPRARHRPPRGGVRSAGGHRTSSTPRKHTSPASPAPGLSVVAILTSNGVRVGSRRYLIRPGDCLSVIAARYGLDWRRLAAINGIAGPDYVIYAGEALLLY